MVVKSGIAQASRPRRPGGRWWKFFVALAVVLEVAWLVTAQVMLNSGRLLDRISRQPEKLLVHWDSGWSWLPGRVHLKGVRVRGQGHRDQWWAAADQASLHVRLLPLLKRRVVSDAVHLSGVAFRIRPRLDAVLEGRVDPANLPPIEGFANPPQVAPTFRTPSTNRPPWTLDLRAIQFDGVREIWINENRLRGEGRVSGKMHYEIRGPFTVEVEPLRMTGTTLTVKGADALTDLNLHLEGRLGPMRFKEDRGLALFDRMRARLDLAGEVMSLMPFLGSASQPASLAILGSGRVEVIGFMQDGQLILQVDRFALPKSVVYHRGEVVATNLSVRLSGGLDPIALREARGSLLWSKLVGVEAEVRGDFLSLELLQRHLGPVRSVRLAGMGRAEAHAFFSHGRVEPGTSVAIVSTNVEVGLVDVVVSGTTDVQVKVKPPPDGVSSGTDDPPWTSHLSLEVRDLRLRHQGDATAVTNPGELRVEAVAHDPRIPGGFQDVDLTVDLGPMEVPDAQVLNGFLPRHAGMEFSGGRFVVSADYRGSRGDAGGGRFRLDGDEVALRVGDHDYAGRLNVEADYAATPNHSVHLRSAGLLLTNVVVSGVRSRRSDGWYARVKVEEGNLALDGSGRMQGEVALELLDIRPLLALLREDEDSADWAKWVPNLKDLRGGASVRVTPEAITLRDLALRAKATEVLGQLDLREGKPDGVLYTRYGLISAGFDFRNGAKSWTLLGAKRAYFRFLQEMGLEGAAAPEAGEDGANEPGE